MKKLILALAFVVATFTGNAQAGDMSKKDIEKIVHDYIVENPEVIAMSVDNFLEGQRRDAALALVSKHSPVWGEDSAKVTFVEFSDFRCGYCKRVQATIMELREKYKGQVRFVFKHMPILSEDSRAAAAAGLAAHKQGKFWEFSEKIWEGQSRLGEDLFVKIAKDLKLDMNKFNKDRASKEVLSEVQIDLADGKASGVRGTPHFVIDGNALSGAQPMGAFEEAIEFALEAHK